MNLPSLFVLFVGGWGVAPNEKQNLFYYNKRSFLDEHVSAYPSLTIEQGIAELTSAYKEMGAIVNDQKSLVQLLSEHEIRLIAVGGAERYGLLTSVLDLNEEVFDETNKHYCAVAPTASLTASPETSLPQITKTIEAQMNYTKDSVLFASLESIETMMRYKNPDLVSQSIAQTDKYLKKIIQQALVAGIRVLLIGDSSGAESYGQENSEEKKRLLPVVLISKDQEGLRASNDDYGSDAVFPLSPSGSLQDIAPTILSLMHIPKPDYIVGKNLFNETII